MKKIGFSTGAVAYSDFERAIKLLTEEKVTSVEVSALRYAEWAPLCRFVAAHDLSSFDYVSIHLPSSMTQSEELSIIDTLPTLRESWPLILHPDVVTAFDAWRELGSRIYIENMDSRKPIGRTAKELDLIYQKLPDAKLCFDIGHAWQVDPTMNVAYTILSTLKARLGQIHISEVNSYYRHEPLSYSTIQSFRDVADLIPQGTPIILETLLTQDDDIAREEIRREINKAVFALLPVAAQMIA